MMGDPMCICDGYDGARNGGRLLHGLAASYSRIKKSYWGNTMAEIVLPDIDLEDRVVIMTGADRGLGRAM